MRLYNYIELYFRMLQGFYILSLMTISGNMTFNRQLRCDYSLNMLYF